MNTNFEVIGLTRLRIKPKSTAPEADALTTRPSENKLSSLAVLTRQHETDSNYCTKVNVLYGAPFGKKRFCLTFLTYFARVFWSDLEYILSDI